MKLSAKQAAKEVGKSAPTITRAIQKGKLSAAKNDNGGYEIDPAELFRVFPAKRNVKGNVTPGVPANETPNVTSALQLEIKFLRENIEEKEKRLSDKDYVITDLQKRLDNEAEERRKLTMLIADQRKIEDPIKHNNENNALVWALPLFTALLVILVLISFKIIQYL